MGLLEVMADAHLLLKAGFDEIDVDTLHNALRRRLEPILLFLMFLFVAPFTALLVPSFTLALATYLKFSLRTFTSGGRSAWSRADVRQAMFGRGAFQLCPPGNSELISVHKST